MNLTGNPFVDTGLLVISTLANRDSVSELSFDDIRRVFGDGEQLARDNERLKCFTMIFGTNGPLTQPAYRKVSRNRAVYLSILRRLLEIAQLEGDEGAPCDITGVRSTLDFHKVCASALQQHGLPVPERKWLGRDWIPLGGSLGNDAQALPGASRPLHVSALAVFALQYLPLGVFLFKGKLACLQATNENLCFVWVNEVVEKNRSRLRLGNTEILGKGTGTAAALDLLLQCYEEVSYFEGNEATIWLFTNSGTGADCVTETVPEKALRFAARASRRFGSEIRTLLKAEPKDPRFQMFDCIRAERDYHSLYASKKAPGASSDFYEFYQKEITGADDAALTAARKLANYMLTKADKKELKDIRKPEYLKTSLGRNKVRKAMLEVMEPSEYDALFPSEWRPIRVRPTAWQYLRFYLSTPVPDERNLAAVRMKTTTTHPKIIKIAETYRSVDPKKIRSLLDRMAQRKIGLRWLQDKFCKLAELYPEWELGEWDEFVRDEEGNVVAFELLFQIRLYLSNLYRQLTSTNKGEAA